MQKLTIGTRDEGQTLVKYLERYMKLAPKSFFYKMLRKKNIVLNDKKSDGTENLKVYDVVTLFLSDETIDKFKEHLNSDIFAPKNSENAINASNEMNSRERHIKKIYENSDKKIETKLDVLYEDDNVIFVNKPAGILSQKAEPQDVSINEMIIDYLVNNGEITPESMETVRPSICNRLDRNTSGIICAGKSITGLKGLSYFFKERLIKKYYRCIVHGNCTKTGLVEGMLSKDESSNKVTISKSEGDINDIFESDNLENVYNCDENADVKSKKMEKVQISINPLECGNEFSLLEIELITGKTHQIRAQLAELGYPILGDYKYGDRNINEKIGREYGSKAMLLHAYRLEMPDIEALMSEPSSGKAGIDFMKFEEISKWEIIAPLPENFKKIQSAFKL